MSWYLINESAAFGLVGFGPVELVLLAIVALLVFRNVTPFRGER